MVEHQRGVEGVVSRTARAVYEARGEREGYKNRNRNRNSTVMPSETGRSQKSQDSDMRHEGELSREQPKRCKREMRKERSLESEPDQQMNCDAT